jgi:hypothetical protein
MELPCPACGKRIRIPDQQDQPGRKAKCIHCRASFVAPDLVETPAGTPSPSVSRAALDLPPVVRPRTRAPLDATPAPPDPSPPAEPLWQEVPRVLAYPLGDLVNFAILAGLTLFFNAGRAVGMGLQATVFAYVFGQGLLMAYAFTALNRVAHGKFEPAVPELAGLEDVVRPLRLSIAAFLISAGPLVLVAIGSGAMFAASAAPKNVPKSVRVIRALPSVPATPVDPEIGAADPTAALKDLAATADAIQKGNVQLEEPAAQPPALPAWTPLAFGLALAWLVAYFPVAFMVAAISQSFFTTLNPLEGLRAILAMGATYWQATALAALLFAAHSCVAFALKPVPVAYLTAGSVADAYAWLALGCLLGLAIHKKARELGFD